MRKQQTNGLSSALGAAERSEDKHSETERSAAVSSAVAAWTPRPGSKAARKTAQFSGRLQEKILAEADAAAGTGAIGALLRREGLYSSHLTHWRRERIAGITQGLTPRTRGLKPHADPSAKQVQQLRRENERLTERLRKAEIIIDVQKSGLPAGSDPGHPGTRGSALMTVTVELAAQVGTASACIALGLSRASFYRRLAPLHGTARARAKAHSRSGRFRTGSRAHPPAQRTVSESFPHQVHATLLDEGQYPCSRRTMYRMLAEAGQTRERRDQLIHPSYSRPELLASAPNRLWSWDITKLLGPAKWTYFYLYVVLDVFSRYVVGWMLAHRESAHLAKQLIADTCRKQKIAPGQLTVHADRGSSMTSKPVAFLLSDLGVTKTHSRPHFSNDNPYSESQFRTMKYRPGFPDRFGSIQDARIFAVDFFRWYNEEHHHSGISLLTPAALHYGRAPLIIAQRQAVLDAAYIVHYTENATVFGQQTENNIRLAILSMPPGSILIAWQGTRPGRLGSALVFVHEFSLYLRAPESASVGYEDIFNWLVNDVPSSGSLSTCHRRSATRL